MRHALSVRPATFRCFLAAVIVASVLGVAGAVGIAGAAPVSDDDPECRALLVNLGLAYQLFDAVFNGHDPAAAETLIAADAVIGTPSGTFIGPDGLLAYVGNIREVYLDASFAITSLSATDDTVVIGWTLTATQYVRDTVELVPVELAGVSTITVDGGEVAGLSEDSKYLIVAGPSSDLALVPPEIVRGQPSWRGPIELSIFPLTQAPPVPTSSRSQRRTRKASSSVRLYAIDGIARCLPPLALGVAGSDRHVAEHPPYGGTP